MRLRISWHELQVLQEDCNTIYDDVLMGDMQYSSLRTGLYMFQMFT
jgi:hypothetical protein